jgi:hypothetical protein
LIFGGTSKSSRFAPSCRNLIAAASAPSASTCEGAYAPARLALFCASCGPSEVIGMGEKSHKIAQLSLDFPGIVSMCGGEQAGQRPWMPPRSKSRRRPIWPRSHNSLMKREHRQGGASLCRGRQYQARNSHRNDQSFEIRLIGEAAFSSVLT